MASVFKKDDNFVKKQPRNTYDLSFQNNLTTNFGKLVPVLCQEVLPGDSFRIKPTFGLRFMPQVFPVQTRMRAHIHYFYVRNRTLWKDWMDFIGKSREGLVSPYLKFTKSELKELHPSSLYDYLGVPTYLRGEKGLVWTNSPKKYEGIFYNVHTKNKENILPSLRNLIHVAFGRPFLADLGYKNGNAPQNAPYFSNPYTFLFDKPIIVPQNLPNSNEPTFPISYSSNFTGNAVLLCKVDNGDYITYPLAVQATMGELSEVNQNVIVTYQTTLNEETEIAFVTEILGVLIPSDAQVYPGDPVPYPNITINTHTKLSDYPTGIELGMLSGTFVPYASEVNNNGERISALPFRAYEAIYNSFYRNVEVTPFIKNGRPEYNTYVTNDEGGADTTPYHLFNRPWGDDRFTTCRVSPQAGDAPLVGLTGVQGATLTMSSDDGTTSTLSLKVDATSGKVIAVDESESNAAETLVTAINSTINYGITISDLRNVNSFQKWLENKNRRGFKYVDQMSGHYGVRVRYDVLQMPEFIGGVSRDVVVNQISQTVETDTGNLGDIAGQAGVVGKSKNISCYCDEHGFIIGIMSVVPAPMYSQSMPKYLLKSDPFDYFFPEFGKIGYQPIKNKEISYLQSWYEDKQDEVFGYQRAWYDYLENLDDVHGLFKSDLKNFLLGRVFGKTPELSSDFLYVKNTDLNNIFYVNDDNDKILGQIYHDIKAKRQIPLYGIPQLD